MIDKQLLQKYNVPVPRYTSYPTVPYWKDGIDAGQWKNNFSRQFSLYNQEDGISLYLHLPFCESLCTYCGCNKRITTNHTVENEYMAVLLTEWDQYLSLMDGTPVIRELHIGGGTPTFFSPQHLKKIIDAVLSKAKVAACHDFSIEGHPNNTTKEHLQALYDLGFRRISYGVQDSDPTVQRIINRIQPFGNVRRVTETAREIGFSSINFDLIYGLPCQTEQSMYKTISQAISLKPDRVAFYSYAHVPWTSPGQRLFDESDLPDAAAKMQLYITGKSLFLHNGYCDIGMDHFARKTDGLYKAHMDGSLHRNFMGYTTQHSGLLLGLGVSSISDTGNAYGQNKKTLHGYYGQIYKGEPAVQKGYFLNSEDILFKKYIVDIACRNSTTIHDMNADPINKYTLPLIKKLQEDNLVILDNNELKVTAVGRHFIRNICSAFDLHLQKNLLGSIPVLFSNAI